MNHLVVRGISLLVVSAVGMSFASVAVTSGCDYPAIGEIRYVSTVKLILRAKPDELSKAIKELKYKDAVNWRFPKIFSAGEALQNPARF